MHGDHSKNIQQWNQLQNLYMSNPILIISVQLKIMCSAPVNKKTEGGIQE